MPMFSVVIPVFNRAKMLRQTLGTVFDQEYADYEVIVVDDGSTEDVAAVARQFGDRIKFLRQENRGPGAARNLGIAHAQGGYLVFLDSDDLWFPWVLATYHAVIERCGNPTLVAGALRSFSSESEIVDVQQGGLRYEQFDDYLVASRRDVYVSTNHMVVQRNAIQAIGGFDEAPLNAEDHDLVLRLGTAPSFVCIHSPVMVAYRRHEASETADLSKTLLGITRLVRREREGGYPGGEARRRERQHILTLHTRPASLEALNRGRVDGAWDLYRATFAWQLSQRRWKYLLGFPLQAFLAGLRLEMHR